MNASPWECPRVRGSVKGVAGFGPLALQHLTLPLREVKVIPARGPLACALSLPAGGQVDPGE